MAPFIRYMKDRKNDDPVEILVNAAEITRATWDAKAKTLEFEMHGEDDFILLEGKEAKRAFDVLRRLK